MNRKEGEIPTNESKFHSTRNLKPKILHKTGETQIKPFGKRTKSNQMTTERTTNNGRQEGCLFLWLFDNTFHRWKAGGL